MSDIQVDVDDLFPGDYTFEALGYVERQRRKDSTPDLEAQLSVNDWIKRASECARLAHGCARSGSVDAEIQAWTDMAAIAVGRIEFLLKSKSAPQEEPPSDLPEEQTFS